MAAMESLLLTSREVAAVLRVHPKHIYRLLAAGLPGKRAGGKWLFDRDEVLRWAAARGHRAMEPAPPSPPRAALLAANGDLAIEELLSAACDRGAPLIGFVQADRATALGWLQDGWVTAAGCHGEHIPAQLGADRLVWLHLCTRHIGLCTRGRPVRSLAELGRLSLGSRPPSAGMRAHLDHALRKAGLDPDRIHRSATLFASHREVVFAVAREQVDVGLASQAWTARLGLGFRSLTEEPYGLLLRAADLGEPATARLCEIAQSRAYRARLQAIPGYDASQSGVLRFATD